MIVRKVPVFFGSAWSGPARLFLHLIGAAEIEYFPKIIVQTACSVNQGIRIKSERKRHKKERGRVSCSMRKNKRQTHHSAQRNARASRFTLVVFLSQYLVYNSQQIGGLDRFCDIRVCSEGKTPFSVFFRAFCRDNNDRDRLMHRIIPDHGNEF